MPSPKIKWPPDEEVQRVVDAAKTQREAAQKLGVAQATLSDYLKARGLRGSQRTVEVGEREFDDPTRVEEDQREAEVKYLRSENRKLREAFASRETTIKRIIEGSKVPVRVPKLKPKAPSQRLPVRSVVLPIFDIQYGQLVQPSDTPLDRGTFDGGRTFDQRLTRYVEAVKGIVENASAAYSLDEMIFALGGDFVEGADIFAGQAWQLDRDPVRQVWDLAAKFEVAMVELIRFAREDIGVKRIGAFGTPGNHGKVGGKKSGATPSTMSWDHLWLEIIRDRMTRMNLIDRFEIEPAGALLFEVAEHRFLLIHGDEIRGWGGLPFYGITKFDGRMIRLTDVIYDVCLMGHHHQPASIPNGGGAEFIVSADWVGANNLTRFLAQASRPMQRVVFVSKKWGVSHEPVWLVPRRVEQPRIHSTAA